MALILALILGCGGALAMAGITVVGERHVVEAEDGFPLLTFQLKEKRRSRRQDPPTAGLLFYLQGSSCASAMYAAELLAGATAAGIPAVIAEKRGVDEEGEVDEELCLRHSTKEGRVQDQIEVLDYYLENLKKGTPVILVGTSEGGDVAAAVAAQEPRVSHLVLLATGGGWSQEKELRYLLSQEPGYLGLANDKELDQALEKIRAAPDSLEMWSGLPYRRWSSYLWDPPIEDLLRLDIPIFLGHGELDKSVPVESAQAVVEAFREAKKSNLTYREYSGADHSFHHLESDQSYFPKIELDLVEWFAEQDILKPEASRKLERRVRRRHPEVF